jgi:hypothetical protein
MINCAKNYKLIGTVDIENIKTKLSNISENNWDEFVTRQKTFAVHANTKTLPIIWDLQSLNSLNAAKKTKYYDLFDSNLYQIKNILKNYYGNGRILRIIFTKLKSNSKILEHRDTGKGLEITKRIHIPIVTNTNVIFKVNGELKNMKEGEMWQINNQLFHSVTNNSDYDRIHLIIDYLQDTSLFSNFLQI